MERFARSGGLGHYSPPYPEYPNTHPIPLNMSIENEKGLNGYIIRRDKMICSDKNTGEMSRNIGETAEKKGKGEGSV